MRASFALVIALAMPVLPAALPGQDLGPRAGTWGAEMGETGGATLLRFRSQSGAWILGAATSHRRVHAGGFVGLGATSGLLSRSTIRVGYRWYRNPGETIRPFTTVGPVLLLTNVPGQRIGGGASIEMGSMQFLSRNVSLGAAGELRAEYFPAGRGAIAPRLRTFRVLARGARVIAAVYF